MKFINLNLFYCLLLFSMIFSCEEKETYETSMVNFNTNEHD
jgi:hypothetical protein